jgi:hexosaminidase
MAWERDVGRMNGMGWSLAAVLMLSGGGVQAEGRLAQADLDHLASTLSVGYRVIDNHPAVGCRPAAPCHLAELTLDAGPTAGPGGWAYYFSSVMKIEAADSAAFALEHINGDLYRLTPTASFTGGRATIPLRLEGQALSEYYTMPNAYLAADGLAARTVAATAPVIDPETGLERVPFVAPYVDEARLAGRSDADTTVWATASRLYAANLARGGQAEPGPAAILPTPQNLAVTAPGSVSLQRGVRVKLEGLTRAEVAVALARLARAGVPERPWGRRLTITRPADADLKAGGYALNVDDSLRIQALDGEGASNALTSLAALVEGGRAPRVAITDNPRFGFRGMHLDVARNFHSRAAVLALLEQMATYKLNRLHLHLGDDEGWRVQIEGLPELTEIGSRRCHDLNEDTCLLPQLGSGPDPSTPVNGYFSKADYVEIVRAAQARHIQVIPSFDMPGHSRASVRAMEARARRLIAQGQPQEAARYRLSEPANTSVYSSIQHYDDNTLNVCLDSSYAFLGKVVDELAVLHRQAGQPLTRYHIGADETPGAWVGSPACQAYSARTGVAIADLGGHFIERVSADLAAKGIVAAGWSDGMGHARAELMPKVVQSNNWGGLAGDGPPSAHRQANQGWEVVISTPEVLYFDSPQATDPKERGYDWPSRVTDDYKVFSFMPENLPAHAELWKGMRGQDQASKDEVPLAAGKAFTGVQGQLWSETVRSDAQLEYMVYPRLLALAERAWHAADWEIPYQPGKAYDPATGAFTAERRAARDADWRRFSSLLGGRELARLDAAGLAWRVPTVGAVIENGRLKANVAFPGLPIEYRVEGGPWTPYVEGASVSGRVEVRARSADGKRPGRSLVVQ